MNEIREPAYRTTSIRLNADEQAMFHELAERLKVRSVGAAIRRVCLTTVEVLREQQDSPRVGESQQ